MTAGRVLSGDSTAVDAIVALWRLVRSRAFHGPGCGCCGAQPVVLDPAILREDIEDMLRRRRRAQPDPAGIAILDHVGSTAAFIAWVSAIGAMPTSPSRTRLLDEIAETLRSMTGSEAAAHPLDIDRELAG